MRVQTLLYFYGRRVRTHPIQELLAGLGIAIGVALAFAMLVANSSIAGSAETIMRAVVGRADVQLQARSANGFDARVLDEVLRLPGVRRAAPVLEQRATLRGPNGREIAVDLGSLDPRLAALSGRLAGNFVSGGFRFLHGALLPSAAAQALGLPDPSDQAIIERLPAVRLTLRGTAHRVRVAAVLGRETIGPVSNAHVAMLPLRQLQQLAGMEGRLTRVLVETAPGRETQARAGLAALAARHHVSLTSATAEAGLLSQALGPSDQATAFFAAISALLGFLLAFNAMLLTAPERRRRMLAELRMQGFKPRQLVGLLLFQALVLGIVSSLLGVFVGSILSHGVFNATPDYLSPAFTLGTGTVVGTWPIALALGGGTLACCLAAAPPLLDLRRGRAVDAVFHAGGSPGNALELRVRLRLFAIAVALLGLATAVLAAWPSRALVACGLLALATVLAIPMTFSAVVYFTEVLTARFDWLNMLSVALLALRATTVRSLALAATGAVAVFGSVAIGGARNDLLHGIARYTGDYVGTANLWVVNPLDNQATNEIAGGSRIARIAAVPGVEAVRRYHGGFLDFDGRRVWVIARSPADRSPVPASQLVRGQLAGANERLQEGGWVVVSEQIARAHHVGLGDPIAIPTPTGTLRLRVAALTTNLGWSPGALILGAADYRRAWASAAPTALEVDIAPGADRAAVRRGVMQAAGATAGGLVVQTAAERAAGINASARQGLARLGQISGLLLIAAVLAMAAAMGAAIWQRRASLAALRIQSFSPRQLWRVLLMETSVVLGAGCLTGALVGIYGQVVIDRYLRTVTGFPVASTLAGWSTFEIVVLVVVAALAVVAIPGWFAARVPPQLGLQDR
jgi:putative ABC transport system permease protein